MTGGIDRRALLGAGAAAGAAAAAFDWTVFASSAAAVTGNPGDPVQMRSDGTYATVPLKKDTISIAVAQTRVVPVELGNIPQTRLANVQHMCDVIDTANGFSGAKDLICFHEFPITGYRHVWNLEDAHKVAIELPGEESEMLAAKAREYGSWLVFGSYVRDPDWSERLLSIATVMNDKGEIVASASPENKYYLADSNPGHAGIVGPDGEFVERSETDFETLVYGRIPIGSFRARHRQPIVHSELVMPIFEQYRSPYGPNLLADYQPTDTEDAGRYLREKTRW